MTVNVSRNAIPSSGGSDAWIAREIEALGFGSGLGRGSLSQLSGIAEESRADSMIQHIA